MVYNIYTDGSYKKIPGLGEFYGSAAFIVPGDDVENSVTLTKAGNDEYVSLHNVSGEIFAVMMAMEHCLNVLHVNKEDTVRIFHDYVGIANWVKRKGEPDYWRAKNQVTQTYAAYMNSLVKTATNLTFHHVTGHSGNVGNELVDKLAKQAIDEYANNLREGLQ